MADQIELHGGVAHAVVLYLVGPRLHRVGIFAQMYFAPLAPILSVVFLAFRFALFRYLTPGLSQAGPARVSQASRACEPVGSSGDG